MGNDILLIDMVYNLTLANICYLGFRCPIKKHYPLYGIYLITYLIGYF